MMTAKTFMRTRITPPSKKKILLHCLYGIFAISLAGLLISLSEHLAFYDQDDFIRVVDFMLSQPSNRSSMDWPFKPEGIKSIHPFNIASYIFGFFGLIQSWYSDHFELRFSSIFAKIILIIYADIISQSLSRFFTQQLIARSVAFLLLCISMFYAHNIGILKSFYAEYVFYLFFPLLIIGFFHKSTLKGKLAIVSGSLFCGIAKVQFFYIPTLVIICLLLIDARKNQPINKKLIGILFIVQIICLFPLKNNPYAQLNYHQSTYFGSYLVLTETQLHALGLDERKITCVGIDGWGHKAQGPGGSQPQHVGHSCYGEQHLGLTEVLAPYLKFPGTLPKLMAYALPQHFTIHYFHLYQHYPYLIQSNGKSFESGIILNRLSDFREKTVTRLWITFLILGILLPFLKIPNKQPGLAITSLFLSLFILSQIVISLLGEGIRDLSKHLWAAQLALDFLVLTILAQIILSFIFWKKTKPSK